jgi:hypothetical protein
MDWLKSQYEKVKTAVAGPVQSVADTTGISEVNVPDVQPETSGMTTTGGKRLARKTRRAKKSKKTLRRKH